MLKFGFSSQSDGGLLVGLAFEGDDAAVEGLDDAESDACSLIDVSWGLWEVGFEDSDAKLRLWTLKLLYSVRRPKNRL